MVKFLKRSLLLLGTGLAAGLQAQEAAPDGLQEQSLVAEWLKTEQLIATEALAWQEQQKHLGQLLELYQKELALLDTELAAAGQNAGLVDEEVEDLKKSIADSESARRAVIEALATIKPRVETLIPRLPEPLQDQLLDQTAALEEPVTNENAGPIFRSVVKVLQEAADFNRRYFFSEETIVLGGAEYQAKLLYFGLSRAFFLAGDKAGIATPGPEGWAFAERNELADELERAFAIQAKETPSALFEVPLERPTE